MSANKAGIDSAFASVYQVVQSLVYEVEALAQIALKEDARKVARLAKRVSLVLSDLQPYVAPSASPALATVLKEIETSLSMMLDTIHDMAAKGPLASFLEADRALSDFQAAASHLEESLGAISGRLPEETAEELTGVRALLARTHFELAPSHATLLNRFREGVDALVAAHDKLVSSCTDILGDITGKPGVPLTREAYEVTLKELIAEHTTLVRRGDPYSDAHYVRTMIDVLRLQHKPSDIPPAYVCPLTHQVMKDPVVLQETGQSYERKAIEAWYSSGHRICPRSGQKLGWRLHLIPNSTLQEAIQEWLLHGALATSWQPLMATLSLDGAAPANGEGPISTGGSALPGRVTSRSASISAAGAASLAVPSRSTLVSPEPSSSGAVGPEAAPTSVTAPGPSTTATLEAVDAALRGNLTPNCAAASNASPAPKEAAAEDVTDTDDDTQPAAVVVEEVSAEEASGGPGDDLHHLPEPEHSTQSAVDEEQHSKGHLDQDEERLDGGPELPPQASNDLLGDLSGQARPEERDFGEDVGSSGDVMANLHSLEEGTNGDHAPTVSAKPSDRSLLDDLML